MENEAARSNFIWDAIDQDLSEGRAQQVHTRFPPEPNGYLHIGHCKALVTDFGTAEKYGGLCNLRFDDTNPAKEDNEYAEGIQRDIEWLGFHWNGGLYYASDYYQRLYDIAEDFINRGLAYVDELSADEMREYRGTLTTPGKNSPWRDRPAEENLSLFRRMKNGEFPEGKYILRAKIDMASPNMNMTSPIPCPTPSRASPIPSAPWSLRITGRCTTGSWKRPGSARATARGISAPGRSSSPG